MGDTASPHWDEHEHRITIETIADLLDSHNTMSLATTRDGAVYAASLFYASEGLKLYYVSKPDSVHSVNISVNPEAAVTISKDHSDWRKIRGLQMRGKAYELPGSEAEAARRVFEQKYHFLSGLLGNDGLFRGALEIVFYKFVPYTVRLIDNSVHFGYRAELSL